MLSLELDAGCRGQRPRAGRPEGYAKPGARRPLGGVRGLELDAGRGACLSLELHAGYRG